MLSPEGREQTSAGPQLLDTAKHYQAIFQNSPMGIEFYDARGILLHINQASRRIFGLDPDEPVAGFRLFEDPNVPPAVLAQVAEGRSAHYKALFDFEKVKERQLYRTTRNGSLFLDVTITPLIQDNSTAAAGYIVQVQDITQEKQIEDLVRIQQQQLKASEAYHRALYEHSLDGIMLYDGRRFISCNRRTLELFDCPSEEEFCRFQPWELAPPRQVDGTDSMSAAKRIIAEALEQGHCQVEWLCSRTHGGIFPAEVWLLRLEPNGSPVVQITIRDISKRREMEMLLRQSQRIEAIGTLASGIAHELNTPAQYVSDNLLFLQEAVTALSEIAKKSRTLVASAEECSTSPELAKEILDLTKEKDLDYLLGEIPEAVTGAIHGVERITTIVRAMKAFAHPGSADRKLVDVNKAIENTTTVSRNEWKYVAELKLDLDPHLPLIPCYASELNQAILNLVVNAAQAIAEKVGSSGKRGEIVISTKAADGLVSITIADTGAGIPETIRNRVFDLFFTTKEIGRGSGQGLALVHSVIVEKHKGTVAFETEEGKGTAFTITLPMSG